MLPVPSGWSEVTPTWMTAALTSRLPDVLVERVDVVAVGEGTNSRARVALTYSQGEGPPSVFVKRSGRLLNRLAQLALRAVGIEARLAASGVSFPLEHPRLYAGGLDARRLAAFVVMDDIVCDGGRPSDPTAPLTVDQVRLGLEGLAGLHAAYWNRPLPAPLAFLQPWRFGKSWSPISVASLAHGLRRFEALGSTKVPRGADARSLEWQFRRSAVMAASGDQTLLHGDPHLGNTYTFAAGRTGFLDWELARTGHWSHDVGYFVTASLEIEDRRTHDRELVAAYLDALGRAGATPPDAETAWARYRATPAYGLPAWLHTLAFGTFQPIAVCQAMIRRFAAAHEDLDTRRAAVAQ